MSNIITQKELDNFYLDLCDLKISNEFVFLDFVRTLNLYERNMLALFLGGIEKDICYTILLIYNKFYNFISERNVL